MSKRGENIRKRKDGRWEGRYLQCINGKKSYRSVYAKTYSEVKEKLLAEKAKESEKQKQANSHYPTISVDELSVLWFAEVKKLRKYSTYRKYMDIYENYIHEQLGKLSIAELNSDLVAQILPRQLSNSIHRSIYCVLNQMLRYGSIYMNIPSIKLHPCVVGKKAEPVEVLSFSDQKKLLNYLYVVIQTGYSTYEPIYCTWSKLYPYSEMIKYVSEARIVITHYGHPR